MATIGTLAAFDAKNQSWEEYCKIMEQFFEANEIDDGDKQRAILLSVVGASTYSLMRNLLSPEKPKEKTYHQLVVLLKNHFDPKPSEIVQRYKFDSRSRNQNESVMDYVAELRRLAQDWDGPTLLGRGWLEDIQLDWKEVKARREARQVHHVHSGKKTTLREVLCNNEAEGGGASSQKEQVHLHAE
uniref:Retrotransposon gag domain-containing protein n=1 Tax=Knipowitschia caucasica TaxID=637954 RepID=A0AAV2LW61_KNICA